MSKQIVNSSDTLNEFRIKVNENFDETYSYLTDPDHSLITVEDSSSINLTLSGQHLTAEVTGDVVSHLTDLDNPHNVTADQISGLVDKVLILEVNDIASPIELNNITPNVSGQLINCYENSSINPKASLYTFLPNLLQSIENRPYIIAANTSISGCWVCIAGKNDYYRSQVIWTSGLAQGPILKNLSGTSGYLMLTEDGTGVYVGSSLLDVE